MADTEASTLTYSGPITITEGGTYSGNWESLDPDVPAVDIRTTEPVIITNSNIRSEGILIKAHQAGADVTVTNTNGYALVPDAGYYPGRFINALGTKNLVVEHNYLEGTGGIYVVQPQTGGNISIQYNSAKDINGRKSTGDGYAASDSGGFYRVQFVQFDKVSGVTAEIAWNQVINDPYVSRVEDVINMYQTTGTDSSPILIHDNYIKGAYPGDPDSDSYSGGGIIADSSSSGLKVYNNTVLETVNYGIAIAGGSNNEYYGNTVIGTGILPDGSRAAGQNVGMYVSGGGSGNTVHDNTVGWYNADGNRNDWWFPSCPDGSCSIDNVKLDSSLVTTAEVEAQFAVWEAKLAANNLAVGLGGSSGSGDGGGILPGDTGGLLPADGTLTGTDGDDTLTGTDGNDVMFGAAGSDALYGQAGDDTLDGGTGWDTLDGGPGADAMTGGPGDDTYIVDNAGDTVIEIAAGGVDLVQSGVGWSLPGEVENLTLTGTADSSGTGNALANTILGNDSNNAISGGDGDDVLKGQAGDDSIDGGSGQDAISGNDGNDTLRGDGDNDTLHGGYGDDSLYGGFGGDVLNGNEDSDLLDGGDGWDWLNGGAGVDVLAGGLGDDTLSGGDGDDTVLGGEGKDSIKGEAGNDGLVGGPGKDRFMFDTAPDAATNVDRIFDFSSVDDDILLSGAVFGGLGPTGTLAGNAFCTGSAARDAEDRIIYDRGTGALSYDADGTGATSAIQFATVSTGLRLSSKDFIVV